MPAYIIIGGTGSGIGGAIADSLTTAGHKVYRTSRRQEAEADILLDATDFDAVDIAFSKVLEKESHIEGVVNCAGSLLLKPAHLTTAKQYHHVIDASLTTSFAVARAAGKYMTNGGVCCFHLIGGCLAGACQS
jgi:NAD(P)-dependent dehydrogenase (short-subunit alcohol dehydrogenase family)